MLVTHGHKFSAGVWGLIVDELRNIMKRAEPTWIFFALSREDEAKILEPHIDCGGESPSKLQTSSLSSSTAATVVMSSHEPSVLGMYPDVVATLGFTFATSFPPKVISAEEVKAQRIPSCTHLAVLLALQRLAGNVLASRQRENLSISVGQARSLLSCLRESFVFARKVNDALPLRRYLQRVGWRYGRTVSSSNELPSLLPQEVMGKQQYLQMLFTALTRSINKNDLAPFEEQEEARGYMARMVQDTLEEYLAWTGVAPQHIKDGKVVPADAKQRVESFTPLIVATLREIAEFDNTELQRHMSWLYPLLTLLMLVPNVKVRVALSNVFSKGIRQLLLPR
ncbi:unnamed protein product [Peronospora destructor]|uniref:Sec7/BIG1-like C-terminal domain-containing protein n=1 Tax=Peronospora destructor TaxID=86335 RepID=A0AAV0UAD5_9STRA|nr:unnamed protein product [Peronospora destructor]